MANLKGYLAMMKTGALDEESGGGSVGSAVSRMQYGIRNFYTIYNF
jgi:hypothetical protein